VTEPLPRRGSSAPLSVVVLTGDGEHSDPWHALPEISARVAEVLVEQLALRTGSAPSIRLASTAAGPAGAFDGADVVLLAVSADLAEEPADSTAWVDALDAHSTAGGGIVALHSAALAFRGDARWASLLGGRWVPGITMHPQIGHALVQTTDAGSTAGAPAADFVLYDERYTGLETAGHVEVLALHTEDGQTHPLVWRVDASGAEGRDARGAVGRVARGSAGRVVYDALGHGVESFDSPEHRALLGALVAWAAGLS
jgi:type 1 glutamine amidotransferase